MPITLPFHPPYYRLSQNRTDNDTFGNKLISKNIKHSRIFKEASSISPLLNNNKTAVTDQEKCRMLASHLENRFQHSKAISPIDTKVHNTIDLEFATVHNQLNYTTPKEIKNYIRNIPHRKTPGDDMISNIVLKNLNSNAIAYLVNIFNFCLRHNYFPKSWENAIVETIYKSGKPKNAPSSYQPTSLLNSISKLFDKVLHTRITQFTQDTSLWVHKTHSTTSVWVQTTPLHNTSTTGSHRVHCQRI
jgi:hypothetical protein